GTLDPLATGVLVLCLGPYTRLSEWISSGDKEYDATLRLGAVSDTGDAQGQIEAVSGKPIPSATLRRKKTRSNGKQHRADRQPAGSGHRDGL
ncbi:MAG: hypothetical protein IH835_09545, partial [Proteobacteria bacterium]|nr:hypothetical protein [Pseudomonadota bacterium]